MSLPRQVPFESGSDNNSHDAIEAVFVLRWLRKKISDQFFRNGIAKIKNLGDIVTVDCFIKENIMN